MNLSPVTRSDRLTVSSRLFLALTMALAATAYAANPSKEELREQKREGVADDGGAKPKKRDDYAEPRTGKASQSDAQVRQMDKLRERLEVTDDAEWALIVQRVTKVEELRRSVWPAGGDKGKRPASGAPPGTAERDALRSALGDKLPDAEIKSRLARAHEAYQQNEARLQAAQAELRAVLTIRQEAHVVMAGLLPP